MNRHLAFGMAFIVAAVVIAVIVSRDPRLIKGGSIPDVHPMPSNTAVTASNHGSLPDADKALPSRPSGKNTYDPFATTSYPPGIRSALERFADTSVPIRTRIQEIAALGKKGDADSRVILMALGNARLYANRYAVNALGHHRGPDVTAYLTAKLTDRDALILCAAIRALARSTGKASIPELSKVFANNRQRHDGHEDMVCMAAAVTLGRMGDASAIPALVAELNRSEEKGWDLEYGSVLVKALCNVSTPGIRAPLAAYADRLAARVPDDPMAKKHFETKIAEARAAAAGK